FSACRSRASRSMAYSGRAAIAVTADLRDAGGSAVSPQNTSGSTHPDPPWIHARFAATADSADSAVIAGMSTGVWVWSASAVTNSDAAGEHVDRERAGRLALPFEGLGFLPALGGLLAVVVDAAQDPLTGGGARVQLALGQARVDGGGDASFAAVRVLVEAGGAGGV